MTQLFTEVLVLGLAAAALGLWGSHQILAAVKRTIDHDELPFWIQFDPGLRTIVFVVVALLLVVAIGGAVPGFRATRRNLASRLHASGRGGRGGRGGREGTGRLGTGLTVAQVALSIALVSGAGFIAWAVSDESRDRGSYEPGRVLTAHVDLSLPSAGPSGDHPVADSASGRRNALRERLAALPGVRDVGFSSALNGLNPLPQRTLVDRGGEPATTVQAARVAIEHHALEILAARPLVGRLFDERDDAPGAERVAVVNDVFAREHLSGSAALGRRIASAPRGANDEGPEWYTVVGITPDVGVIRGGDRDGAGYFIPMTDERDVAIAVLTSGQALRLAEPIRRAAFDLNPEIQFGDFSLLEHAARRDRRSLLAMAAVLLAVGIAALALSLVGIYATMSFAVTSRTREIGIRMALGADAPRVLRTVVGRSAMLLAAGSLLGSAGAVALNRLMRAALVYEIPNAGFVVVPPIVVAMILAGVAASWIPARRALAVRPVEAMSAQ